MNDLQVMAARAALKKMLSDGYFSICTVDKILKMTGGVPNREDYDVLSTLHCVHYMDMEPELLRGLPLLIQRVLSAEELVIVFSDDNRKLTLVR